MRIVYIGTVDFSYHCLEDLLSECCNVVGVVAAKSSTYNSDFRDLGPLAKRHNIPVHYFKNINEVQTVEWIRSKRPDIIFCWGISQLIKQELLSMPPMGIIGVHPTLLPQNRGRHPLIWALVLGLRESGLTFFFMREGADSGPILSQRRFKIGPSEDATTLYDKIKKSADVQIPQFLPKLISGQFQALEQDEQLATTWRKRSQLDGIIDWRMNTQAILALVRALTKPYPGAEFKYRDQRVTLWRAEKYREAVPINIEPGKIIKVHEGRPIVKCYGGAILLSDYEPRLDFVAGQYLAGQYLE